MYLNSEQNILLGLPPLVHVGEKKRGGEGGGTILLSSVIRQEGF